MLCALHQLHLKAVRKYVNSSLPQGQVVSQSPTQYPKVAVSLPRE